MECTAEIATWSITILGFCVAGWSSATIPRWLAAVGLFAAAAGLLSSTFVVSVINGGWATTLIDLTTLTSLVWFLCVGVYMGVRGSSSTTVRRRGCLNGDRSAGEACC